MLSKKMVIKKNESITSPSAGMPHRLSGYEYFQVGLGDDLSVA